MEHPDFKFNIHIPSNFYLGPTYSNHFSVTWLIMDALKKKLVNNCYDYNYDSLYKAVDIFVLEK